MMQSKRAVRVLLSGILVSLIGLMMVGCATYFKVTDTATDREYYTQNVVNKSSGAVEFVDAKTKAKVTLQSSEVRQISEQTYEEELAAQ